MPSDVACSWCLYNEFVPISAKIVKSYNCNNLKCLEEGIKIERLERWDDVDY